MLKRWSNGARRVRVPHERGAILAGRGEARPIGAELHPDHGTVVALRFADEIR